MKILFKSQTIQRKNSDVCVVTEYPIEDQDLDFAKVRVTARYPQKGCAVNLKSKEIVYVHEGEGKVVVNETEHALGEGDIVIIEAGEKFYWDGNLHLFISCTPAFTVEQHKVMES